MDGAALAEKRRTELLQNPIRLNENPLKPFDVLFFVRSVMSILVMRRHIVKLRWSFVDLHLDSKRSQRGHVLGVEIRHRARVQSDSVLAPLACADPQPVGNKIELDLEGFALVWDRTRGETKWSHIQRHVPPVIDERLSGHSRLADNLG